MSHGNIYVAFYHQSRKKHNEAFSSSIAHCHFFCFYGTLVSDLLLLIFLTKRIIIALLPWAMCRVNQIVSSLQKTKKTKVPGLYVCGTGPVRGGLPPFPHAVAVLPPLPGNHTHLHLHQHHNQQSHNPPQGECVRYTCMTL